MIVSAQANVIAELMRVLEDRKKNMPEKSYTTRLLKGGLGKIGGKIREEAEEIVTAATQPGSTGARQMVHEAADLIYHLLVLLTYRGIPLEKVEAELARRFGISGIEEKAARALRTPHVG